MRITSFILAFAFILAGPSMAGSVTDQDLPGVGTFSYNGSSPANPVSQAMIVAAK